MLLSGGTEGLIKVFETESGRELFSFRAYPESVKYAAFSPDGKMIASCGGGFLGEGQTDTAVVSLWDARNGSPIRKLKDHSGEVTYLDFHPLGGTLVSASDDKTLKLWSVVTGRLISTIQTNGKNAFVDYSPDGKTLAAVTIKAEYDRPEIGFFSVQSGEKLAAINDNVSWGGVAISANWRYFAVTSGEQFKVWEIQSKKLVRLERSPEYLSNLAVSSDGSILVLGGRSSPTFWSPEDTRNRRVETPSLSFTTGLAVSRDGKLVAWGSANEIYVWSKPAATLLYVLRGHSDQINEVTFSPNGNTLASCSNDRVKLWSTENGALLGDLVTPRGKGVVEYHWNGSQSVTFSPDGRSLATGENKVIEQKEEAVEILGIRIWDVNTRRLTG